MTTGRQQAKRARGPFAEMCGTCGKAVSGEMIEAGGQMHHPRCMRARP